MCVFGHYIISTRIFRCGKFSHHVVWTEKIHTVFPKWHTNNPALILWSVPTIGVRNICDITIITSSRIVATSQMHPTHARKTFPCFDEPAMRAVFYITLIHDRGTVALSNGMEIGQFYQKQFRFTHNDYVNMVM